MTVIDLEMRSLAAAIDEGIFFTAVQRDRTLQGNSASFEPEISHQFPRSRLSCVCREYLPNARRLSF
jgi:hypothetical protein